MARGKKLRVNYMPVENKKKNRISDLNNARVHSGRRRADDNNNTMIKNAGIQSACPPNRHRSRERRDRNGFGL